MNHTPETILARLAVAPARFADLAGSKAHRSRIGLRVIVDRLVAQGHVRMVYIDRFPHLVLKDWEPTKEQTLSILEGRGKRTADGCLIWTGYTDPSRGPMASLGSPPQPTSVRRTIWGIKRKPLEFNDTVKPSCGNWECVEYRHMVLANRADPAIGRKKTTLHAMRIAQGLRALKGKLTMEIAREIRASSETAAKLATQYGVSKEAINMVRRGETWKEYQQGLFTGLIEGRRAA